MYAKLLMKESFLVECHSLLEGMKQVFRSSFRLLQLFYRPMLKLLFWLFFMPKVMRHLDPQKQSREVDLPADRWLCHYQHPSGRLYMK